MKRILLSALFAAATILPTFAIGPSPRIWTTKQSDGTLLKFRQHGVERVEYFTTLDGKIMVKNANGDLAYAMIQDGKLVASQYIAHEAGNRSNEEKAFLNNNDVANKLSILHTTHRHARHAPLKAIHASTDDGLGKFNTTGAGGVNSIGTPTIPVIMVEFTDAKFDAKTTKEKLERFYNEVGYKDELLCKGSVKDYFTPQSRGKFVPPFAVLGPVNVNKSYKTYGKRTIYDEDSDIDGLVRDAVNAATAKGYKFDNFKDKDGKVQLVCILYAGKGQATESNADPNTADLIWPCQNDINETIGNTHFNSFFVGNELDHENKLMGMGIFCHEFGHALGLPDFYKTDYYTDGDDPFGFWSIMDGGAYVNDARAPIGYTAYERSYLGWLDIKELKKTEEVVLDPVSNPNGTLAALVRNPENNKEYFIMENRHTDTWYPASYTYGDICTFGNGLLLTHFSYDKYTWDKNAVNNDYDFKHAYVVTANNEKLSFNARREHLFGVNKKQIDIFDFWTGKPIGQPVNNIVVNPDGTIKFTYSILDPAGIENVTTTQQQGDGYYYDLQGRRVTHPTHGIYIHNGKKIVVK